MKKFLNLPLWLWCLMTLLSILKIWLVAGQHIFAEAEAASDEWVFIDLANNLIHFHWLGSYNISTLAKGPFYPIWIAFSYFIHVPLFFSQHLLYILACIILTIALRPLFKKSWILFIIFAIILFNPISFTDGPATRIIREGIYPALTLLVVALFAGIFLRVKGNFKNILLWSVGAGIALSCFWLTREEGIWIMPFAILISGYSLFIIWKEKGKQWKAKIMLIILPFILLYSSIIVISTINYYDYGIFNTVEFNDPAFLSAYGALTRVKGPVWMADVPISAAQRQIIYSISPAFSELKPFLEGDLGKRWAQSGNPIEPNEIQGGWFMWALREAVSQAGSKMLPIYRFYNSNTGEHFYTMSEAEKNSLTENSSSPIKLEGVAFYAYPDASDDKNSLPIYKFSNSKGDFYFNPLSSTKDNLKIADQSSYNSKEIAFYAYPNAQDGTLPVYDFYNTANNEHFYTISETEKESFVKAKNSSYELEGVAFYTYSQIVSYTINGKTAMAYYQRLADEINSACDSGKIACYSRRSSMMPPWNKNYDIPTLNSSYQGLLYTVKFDGFTATPSASIGTGEALQLFNNITRGDVKKNENPFKVSILNNIGKVYIFLSPIVLILAVLIFLFQLLNIKNSYKNLKFILCFSIAASFLARIVGLALINATSFPAINITYLCPLFPLLFIFILLNFLMFSDHD